MEAGNLTSALPAPVQKYTRIHVHIYIYTNHYVCIYIYTYIYTCIYLYIYIYMCIYIYMYIHTHIYIYTYMHMYINIYAYIHLFIYIYINSHEGLQVRDHNGALHQHDFAGRVKFVAHQNAVCRRMQKRQHRHSYNSLYQIICTYEYMYVFRGNVLCIRMPLVEWTGVESPQL